MAEEFETLYEDHQAGITYVHRKLTGGVFIIKNGEYLYFCKYAEWDYFSPFGSPKKKRRKK